MGRCRHDCLYNNGDAAFSEDLDLTGGTGAVALAVRDLDGDGDGDLATANAGSNDLAVFLNNGAGSFAPAKFYPVSSGPFTLAAVDLEARGASTSPPPITPRTASPWP